MNPIDLTTDDDREVVALLCANCRQPYRLDARRAAEMCCCCDICGQPNDPQNGGTAWGTHQSCAQKQMEERIRRDREQYYAEPPDKFQHVQAADYDGWVFFQERYFDDVDSLLESLAEDGLPRPLWVQACDRRAFSSPDMQDYIENYVAENHHEDAFQEIDGLDDLQAAVDAWSAKQTIVSYFPSDDIVVMIPQVTEGR